MKEKGTTWHLRHLAAFVFLVAIFGCSSSNESGTLHLVNASGNHPANFLSTHTNLALSSIDQCKTCHATDLTGGIAKTSCFTSACHHGTNPDWATSGIHGLEAKKAPGSSGFASCQICHGNAFTGGGSGVSCLNNAGCHGAGINSPHPRRPWHVAGTDNTHANTDPANAAVCVGCHANGANTNPPHPPPTPAPAGTPAGCFNSTLCHGAQVAPHLLGATWRDATSTAFHGLAAKADLVYCQGCHGTSGTIRFDGGTAPTKCSTCHTVAKAHPTTWYKAPVAAFPGYVASHRDALKKDTTCTLCHDFTKGRTPPDPSAPSCFSASFSNAEHGSVACHSGGPGGANHDVPFLDAAHTQATQTAFAGNCTNCHAVTGTSPVSSAPLCTVCHAAGSPLTLTGCTSCHGKPPSGTAFPNVAGRHAEHNALTGVTGVCTACHDTYDSGTLYHYDHANARPGKNALRVSPGEAKFPATYNAKSGAASFDNVGLTCSKVSCHGGQTTPNWRTGTINGNTQCTSCHALGTTEYNSYNSGDHGRSEHVSAGCTACHNTVTLAVNHFTKLGTQAMEGPASATIGGGTTSIPEGKYVPSSRRCDPTCHGNKTW